ncbi:phage tail sheath family protein [Hydrogenimonas sp.]
MSEYLSPGVYIEEFEMGAKPIEGVSTSTVGFVGAASYLADAADIANATTAAANAAGGTVKTKVAEVATKLLFVANKVKAGSLEAAKTALGQLQTALEGAAEEAAKVTDPGAKAKAAAAVAAARRAYEVARAQFNADKPVFVSSWADFTAKFGRYSEKAKYLAPAVHCFFANGGKRCYVVGTREHKDAALKGADNGPGKRSGLEALKEVDEVSILAVPGAVSATVQQAMIAQCETLKDRFCILDSEENADMDGVKTQRNTQLTSDKGYGALYYPWIKTAVESETGGKVELVSRFVPPSGAVAGIYARSDTERGVHKAPANEVVRNVTELKFSLTDGEQDILNPLGINCLRAFSGRGIRVWGARTVSSDPLWKYVNIRRLFIYLEESIEEATQWVVFEPNDQRLWARVTQTIETFLERVWRDGALMGNTPEEAFFVRCDRTTMTQDDIDNGRLVVVIGVAPVKPAEFVIFRIAQWTAGAAQ